MGSPRLTKLEITDAQLILYLKKNGSHQANCQEVHWRESSSEAASYQGRSEVNGVTHPQTAVPALSQGDCPGFQDGSQVPKFRCDGSAGGIRLPASISRQGVENGFQ